MNKILTILDISILHFISQSGYFNEKVVDSPKESSSCIPILKKYLHQHFRKLLRDRKLSFTGTSLKKEINQIVRLL